VYGMYKIAGFTLYYIEATEGETEQWEWIENYIRK
jgi:hypothetical protein